MSLEPITAAGGVVFKKDDCRQHLSVLLIFRRGVWDLPKGKLEKGESIKECAVREVVEEVGISVMPQIIFELPDTYHEYEQSGIHYGKTTHWFGMQLPAGIEVDFKPQEEEGIEKVSWFSLSEAQKLVGYDNLKKVLFAFEQTYKSTSC